MATREDAERSVGQFASFLNQRCGSTPAPESFNHQAARFHVRCSLCGVALVLRTEVGVSVYEGDMKDFRP